MVNGGITRKAFTRKVAVTGWGVGPKVELGGPKV